MPATITLKTSGKILVSEGKTVSEGEVVAKEEYVPQLVTINLSKSLSISPKTCKKFLLKDLGEEVKSSEIIAKRKSLFGLKKKSVKASCDGVLERLELDTGELIISLPKVVREVKSPVNGKVKRITNDEIIIALSGEEIYFKKVIGRFSKGEIHVIAGEKVDLFSFDLNVSHKILVGRIWEQAVIEKALAINVSGIIAGETPDFNWEERERGKKLTIGKIEEKIILNLGLIDKDDFKILEKSRGKTAIFDPKDKKLIILQ